MRNTKVVTFVGMLLLAMSMAGTAWAYELRLKGTTITPDAKGEAEVKRKHGESLVKFKVKNLPPASELRHEAVTYVLWSLDPVRREYHNLGEVRVGSSGDEKGKAELQSRTALKRFKLIVTAEPNVTVTQPSDCVALNSK